MHLTIELDREADGRWIADVPELNILLYGETREAAIEAAKQASREIIADKVSSGQLPPEAVHADFAVAA